jgi:hypothetical protein
VAEAVFKLRTGNDGIDLDFDGCSVLFVTIRYRRFAYTTNSLIQAECDPLLFALIGRMDPYNIHVKGMEDNNSHEADDQESMIGDGSKFDYGGCLYRIVQHGTTIAAADRSTCVFSKFVYPMENNPLHGIKKSFDVCTAKEFIERRFYGYVRIHNKQYSTNILLFILILL